MKVVATIEARTGSSRLPKKVLKPILGEPMLARIIERVKRSRRIDEVVVATTDRDEDGVIAELARHCGVSAYRGSENDILDRLAGAVTETGAEIHVSLTGDNPFIDPALIDDLVECLLEHDADYVATTHMQHARFWQATRTFPTGISAQVVRADLVRRMHEEISAPAIRELGLYCIYDDPAQRFKLYPFEASGKYATWRQPALRMTVDTMDDFLIAEKLYAALYPDNPAFSTQDAIRLLVNNPDLQQMNQHVEQRVGYKTLDGMKNA